MLVIQHGLGGAGLLAERIEAPSVLSVLTPLQLHH